MQQGQEKSGLGFFFISVHPDAFLLSFHLIPRRTKPKAKDSDAVADLQCSHLGLGAWGNAKTHNPSSSDEMVPASNLKPTQKTTGLCLGEGLNRHCSSHGACLQLRPQNTGLGLPGPGSRSPSLPVSSREMLPPQPSTSPSHESPPAPSPNPIPSAEPGGFPGHVCNMQGALPLHCRLQRWRRRGQDCSSSA